VHAAGTLQLWWDKLGKVFAGAWGQLAACAGRKGSSRSFGGLFLSNDAINPPVLPPKTNCFEMTYKLSERRRHQRAPQDVIKSENCMCEGEQRTNGDQKRLSKR
jgi:hypothetical protein